MAQHYVRQPAPQLDLGETRQYGVYLHAYPSSSTDKEPQLVNIAADWNTTYNAMLTHATAQIDQNPHWGATREIVTDSVFKIIDSFHIVRLHYDIDTIFSDGIDAQGATIWIREKDWLERNYAYGPLVHYGMYVARNCNDESKTEQFFVGGFKSLGEANHAMKTSAQAHLQTHSGAALLERCVELVNVEGEVRQRYVIEKGRWQAGGFVKEEDWLRGKMPSLFPKPDPNIEATATTKPILRLTPLASISPLTQAASQLASQPQQTENLVHDHTPWCTCRQPDNGRLMVLCENEDCPVQWYHGDCVGIHDELSEEEEWYCPQCVPAQEPGEKAGAKTIGKGQKKRWAN